MIIAQEGPHTSVFFGKIVVDVNDVGDDINCT